MIIHLSITDIINIHTKDKLDFYKMPHHTNSLCLRVCVMLVIFLRVYVMLVIQSSLFLGIYVSNLIKPLVEKTRTTV